MEPQLFFGTFALVKYKTNPILKLIAAAVLAALLFCIVGSGYVVSAKNKKAVQTAASSPAEEDQDSSPETGFCKEKKDSAKEFSVFTYHGMRSSGISMVAYTKPRIGAGSGKLPVHYPSLPTPPPKIFS